MGLDSNINVITKDGKETEIYFRKANAIHRWFVENTQNGVDDCRLQDVNVEKLIEFYDICNKILGREGLQRDILAEATLPTTSGCFFGSTVYDKYYYEDLENVVEYLKPMIESDSIVSVEYHSSW